MAWTDEQAMNLISLWVKMKYKFSWRVASATMQNVYEKMPQEMAVAGYDRGTIQCRDKVKKLRAEYKRKKERQ